MNRVYKLFLFSLATVLATLALGVLAPRTAHAVIATLVQIVNTPLNPVPTIDNSKAALFNAELSCAPNGVDFCHGINSNGTDGGTFTIPAGQYLVIKTVDLRNAGGIDDHLILVQWAPPYAVPGAPRAFWFAAPGGTTLQFQYPSGIAIGPNSRLSIIPTGVSTFDNPVTIRGYMTSF
jgi:hypothetical protein